MKTLYGYCFDDTRLPVELTVSAFEEASFVDERKNLKLWGNVGTRKAHLATTIGIEACSRGKTVRFFRTAALFNQLGEAQKQVKANRFFKQLVKTDLMICDEWGSVSIEQAGSKLLFQVTGGMLLLFRKVFGLLGIVLFVYACHSSNNSSSYDLDH